MNRRDFLKYQAAGLLALAAGPPLPGLAGRALAQVSAPDVAVVKGRPGPAVRAAVELLGGMGRFVKAGQKVVVKPNMSFARGPESGANTHPEVVRELVVLCREAGAGRIEVLDNPLHNPEQCLVQSGIPAAVDQVMPGICRQVREERFFLERDLPQARAMLRNAVMREVLEADVLIAAPVAKSHTGAGVSLSLKGQMGLVLNRHVMHSRYPLDQAIADLGTLIKPNLVVIDATRVLASGGPGGPGQVLTPGEVIASTDPVAADATCVAAYEWYGRQIKPRQVAHLAAAAERGLGHLDIENLTTVRLNL